MTVQLGRALARISSAHPGLIMGALLPAVVEYRAMGKGGSGAMDRLLLALDGLDRYCATPDGQRFDLALARLRQLANTLFLDSGGTLPRTLEDLDIPLEKLERVAEEWSPEQAHGLDGHAVKTILEHAHAGQPIKQGGSHVPA